MGSIWVPHLSHISLLSGTALNIEKARTVLRRLSRYWRKPTIDTLASSFPLDTDEEEFTKVFDSRINELLTMLRDSNSHRDFVRNTYTRDAVFIPANEQTFNSSELLELSKAYSGEVHHDMTSSISPIITQVKQSMPQILRNSIPFRGRYRWSVFYTEKLLENSS
jgi:hypothetical protein